MKFAKSALIWLIVVLLCVLAAGAYLYHGKGVPFSTPLPTSTVSTVTPAIVAGPVVAVSPTSITIQKRDGSKATFAISTSTKLESIVKPHEVGQTVSQLAMGTAVLVVPTSDGVSASLVSVVPLPPPPSAAAGTPASVTGTVTKITPSQLVFTDATGATVTALVPDSVSVRSKVLSGETGKAYSDIVPGYLVQVDGNTTTAGFTAQTIEVLSAQ